MKVSGIRWQVAGLILVLGVPLCGTAPVFAQEKPGAPPAVEARKEIAAAPAPSAKSAEPLKPVPLPAEIQELLADRELLSAEIERLINAEGGAVKIPVSLKKLSARREAKALRYAAWLDAQKIPREWDKAGWRFDGQQFIPPPAPVPPVPPGGIAPGFAVPAKPAEEKP